jgi:hypothetical protein
MSESWESIYMPCVRVEKVYMPITSIKDDYAYKKTVNFLIN